MLIMIAVGVVVVGIAIATAWFVLVRGSKATTTTEADFNAEYDRLVANGEAVDADRAAAWRDFHASQLRSEEERLSWEEPLDE